MEMENMLLAFFIVIIVLTVISILPSRNKTGQFIMPSEPILKLAEALFLISAAVIFLIVVPKKHYNPIPYR
jgi:hypothetical protein